MYNYIELLLYVCIIIKKKGFSVAKKFILILTFAISLNISLAEGVKKMNENINDTILLKEKEKSVSVLFSEGFKVVGLGLMKNQVLEKHSTPNPAFLFIAEGKIEFKMGSKVYSLKAGDFFKIPPKEEHEIIAIENSRLLLTK